MSLSDYIKVRDKERKYQSTIPILTQEDYTNFPSLPFPKLILLDGMSLDKQSYVRYECIFEIPISLLGTGRTMWGKRLDEASYARLVHILRIEPGNYHQTPQSVTAPIPQILEIPSHEDYSHFIPSSPAAEHHQVIEPSRAVSEIIPHPKKVRTPKTTPIRIIQASNERQPLLGKMPDNRYITANRSLLPVAQRRIYQPPQQISQDDFITHFFTRRGHDRYSPIHPWRERYPISAWILHIIYEILKFIILGALVIICAAIAGVVGTILAAIVGVGYLIYYLFLFLIAFWQIVLATSLFFGIWGGIGYGLYLLYFWAARVACLYLQIGCNVSAL